MPQPEPHRQALSVQLNVRITPAERDALAEEAERRAREGRRDGASGVVRDGLRAMFKARGEKP